MTKLSYVPQAQLEKTQAVARAMLAALKAAQEWFDANNKRMRIVDAAIAQAEAAGITTGENK